MTQDKGKKEKKERRRGTFSYTADFRLNEDGEYEYEGDYYQWMIPEEEQKHLRPMLITAAVTSFGLSIIAGLVPAPGTGSCPYVMLPYVFGFIAAACDMTAVLRICRTKGPVREYVYERSVEKIPARAMITMVMAFVCVMGEIIYIVLRSRIVGMLWGFFFIVLEGMILLLTRWIRRKIPLKSWEKLEKEAKDTSE